MLLPTDSKMDECSFSISVNIVISFAVISYGSKVKVGDVFTIAPRFLGAGAVADGGVDEDGIGRGDLYGSYLEDESEAVEFVGVFRDQNRQILVIVGELGTPAARCNDGRIGIERHGWVS